MTIGVLFVCTANICRSPMAEGAFREMARKAGLAAGFEIASAGTSDVKAGEPPSPLAVEIAAARGYDIAAGRARKITGEDIAHFDHILAMTREHLAEIRWLAPRTLMDKPKLLMSFAPPAGIFDVADPYGLDRPDYERALGLIEVACRGLLDRLTPQVKRAI
jgi:protein-tyrosine phosphatase